MRNITVERQKSFVGSLGTFRVYVEDPNSTELVIRGIPCRKVGEVRNGEDTMFEVGDEETRIFVINGEMSKNYCVEMLRLPAGNTDVILTGKCRLNPFAGNAFRFDDNDTEEVKAMRKSGNRNGALVTVVSIIVAVIVAVGAGIVRSNINKGIDSCTSSSAKNDRNFTAQEMDISLSRSFSKESQIGFAARFDSRDAIVYVERIGIDELDDEFKNLTVDEFAQLVVETGGFGYGRKLQYEGDLPYIEFTDTDSGSGEKTKAFVSFYVSREAYWDVQFYTLEKDYSKMRSSFVRWAKSVSFGE